LHMMPATKESWRTFAETMQGRGYTSLAIDLRGHGQSEDGPDGYKSFSDRVHQKSIHDLDAAVRFLEEQGATADRIILIGASIGANVSLKYLVKNPEYKKAVLLSPGLNYRGLQGEVLAKKLRSDQRLLIVASRDDERPDGNAAEFAQTVFEALPGKEASSLIIYGAGGHGTELLAIEGEESVLAKILPFIKT